MSKSQLNTEIRKAIQRYFEPVQNYYWRATNNKNEIELIKSGKFAKSINHASGSAEAGLSVSRLLDYLVIDGYNWRKNENNKYGKQSMAWYKMCNRQHNS